MADSHTLKHHVKYSSAFSEHVGHVRHVESPAGREVQLQ